MDVPALPGTDGNETTVGRISQLVAAIGRRRANHQRNAIAIDQRVYFVPFFRRSTGLGPVLSPPPNARTCVESMIDRLRMQLICLP